MEVTKYLILKLKCKSLGHWGRVKMDKKWSKGTGQ